jgi:tRNA(Arg) A34 adenosine deaminase TadA
VIFAVDVDIVHCSWKEKVMSHPRTKNHPSSEPPLPILPLESDPTPEQMIQHLRRANQIALRSARSGHHPFGAILIASDHDTVLLEQGNIDTVNHAEAVLIRTAWAQLSPEDLWNCTIYSTVEPCAMCAGTQYWANIGRLVYGVSEAQLRAFTGNHPENPTLDLPCRSVFERGQKNIKVWGPFPEVESEIVAIHQDFWKPKSEGIL